MSTPRTDGVTRRAALAGGALVLAFGLGQPPAVFAQGESSGSPAGGAPEAELPGSLKQEPMLDGWIRIEGGSGAVTIFTGKAELGQGIKTALIQIAAEELDVPPGSITIVTADTAQTANEGYTAGSHSMQDSGTAILHAAAQVRTILLGLAAERLSLPADQLATRAGFVVAPDGRALGYGDLAGSSELHVRAKPVSETKDPSTFMVIGTAMSRVDIPAKVTGGIAYVHDLRLPGMVHARVVRPPRPGAQLRALDVGAVEHLPGVVKVVRDGSFLAVAAEREYGAVQAMRGLEAAASWEGGAPLPDDGRIFDVLAGLPSDDTIILSKETPAAPSVRTVEASYLRPYQIHGSIGPSCAVALFEDGKLTVWSHAQGMFPLRKALAEMLGLPEADVRCIHAEGSGCYGHNGADDAAADAALVARALPGRPVRLQWMREQEHLWEPYGPAMIARARASLSVGGDIVDWRYTVRSNTHNARPPGAGQLLAARSLATPFQPSAPKPIPQPEGGGDRNIVPLYELPNLHVVHEFVPEMPLRVSALRSLGAYTNVFAIECFMDELAVAAAIDPVDFRLRHMSDERARDVIAAAAETFGWREAEFVPPGRGRGFAFARYKNLGAYAAVAVEVAVDSESGRVRLVRAVAATDSGQAVNPDGIRNQVTGAILQSASWTLFEAVTFEEDRITSRDWSTYPILRFGAVPDSVEVQVIDRPGMPFLGTGEAAQGPTAAAIGNAVAHATGVRVRELPLSPARVRAAMTQ